MPACDALMVSLVVQLRLALCVLQEHPHGLWTPPRTILVVHPCFCARPVPTKPGLKSLARGRPEAQNRARAAVKRRRRIDTAPAKVSG